MSETPEEKQVTSKDEMPSNRNNVRGEPERGPGAVPGPPQRLAVPGDGVM